MGIVTNRHNYDGAYLADCCAVDSEETRHNKGVVAAPNRFLWMLLRLFRLNGQKMPYMRSPLAVRAAEKGAGRPRKYG